MACAERSVESKTTAGLPFESKYFRRRAARSVKRALGIEADGPKIGGIRIGQQSEFRRELKSAIAAHGHAMRGAFEEFFVSGLAPAASVLGEGRGEAKEVEEVNEVKDSEQACSGRRLGHCGFHRICRFREMTPETGPPSGMEASLANDSRSIWTLPGVGRPSMTLTCESGMFGSSLSSQRSVGVGANRPT